MEVPWVWLVSVWQRRWHLGICSEKWQTWWLTARVVAVAVPQVISFRYSVDKYVLCKEFPFYSKSICGRETCLLRVTEGGCHPCRRCPQPSRKYPTGISLLKSSGSDPCPPNSSVLSSWRGQCANVNIHLDLLMFQTAALPFLPGSPPGSTKLMASFKQIVPWNQKAPPSRKSYSLVKVLQRQN